MNDDSRETVAPASPFALSGRQTKPLAVPKQTDERAVEFVPFGSDEKIRLTVKMVQEFICIPTKSGRRCDEREAMRFVMLCKARGLNPWEGDAYLQGYDGKDGPQFSLITAHQAFLKRAELHPEYDGMESGVIVRTEDGGFKEREGDWYDERTETLNGAWARVFFKTRKHPMYKRLRLSSFQKKWGVWESNPEGMITKCAEADALRSAFPTKLGGMFLAGEVQPEAPGSDAAFLNAKRANVEKADLSSPLPQPRAGQVTDSPEPAPSPEPEPEPPAPVPNETLGAKKEPAANPRTQLRDELRAMLDQAGTDEKEFIALAIARGLLMEGIRSLTALSSDVLRTLKENFSQIVEEKLI